MAFLNHAVRRDQVLVIGGFQLFRQAAVFCSIRGFTENLRHMRHIVAGALGIGGGNLRLTVLRHVFDEILRFSALHEQLNDFRGRGKGLVPLAVVEAGVIDGIPVAVLIPFPLGVQGIFLLHTGKRKFQPAPGGIVMILQNLFVSVHQVDLVRQPYGGISPAHAVLADVAVPLRACQRHVRALRLNPLQFLGIVNRRCGGKGDAHLAAGVLLDPLIGQPFGEELLHIHEVGGSLYIDLGIARPGVPLPGGAVHRHIQKISLLAPPGVFHQLVDERVGAMEVPGLGHIGIHGNGRKFTVLHALDQRIAEAGVGKVGRVFFPLCALADIGDLLKLRHAAVTVGGGEFAFQIKGFPVFEMHHLPRLGMVQHHADIARDILPEVRHQISGAVPEENTGELLLLPNGDTLIGDQRGVGMLCFRSGGHPIPCRNSGIIAFALLQIGFHHRTGADLKGFIGTNNFTASVCIA